MGFWIRKACLWWVYLASVLLVAVVLITVINITAFGLDKLARMFDGNVAGLSGYEDFIRLAISCIALMFFPWAQIHNGHIAIDFLVERFSSKIQKKLDALWLFLTFCLVVFLAIMMFFGMLESKADGALSSILGWAEWPFYIPGIVSLIMWTVVLLYQLSTGKEG